MKRLWGDIRYDAAMAAGITLADTDRVLSGFDYLNLFSSSASIVLAVVALALSVFFFVMAKRDAERADKSASEITSSVDRLEKIFDSLYSDTFSMMRDTVSDMRKHVWTAVPGVPEEVAGGTDPVIVAEEPKVATQQTTLLDEIGEISRRLGIADAQIAELSRQVTPAVQKSLSEARATDSPRSLEERVRTYLSRQVRLMRSTYLKDLVDRFDSDEGEIVNALFSLGRRAIADWEGAPNTLGFDSNIRYVSPARRPQLLAARETARRVSSDEPESRSD
jgi:hypothetical protein